MGDLDACSRVYIADAIHQPCFETSEGVKVCKVCQDLCLSGSGKKVKPVDEFMCGCPNCLFEMRLFTQCHEYHIAPQIREMLRKEQEKIIWGYEAHEKKEKRKH